MDDLLTSAIQENVTLSLKEDIGTGDITAQIIDSEQQAKARIITRDDMIMAGKPWCEAVFNQLDPSIKIDWAVDEGQSVSANSTLFILEGNARSLLTGERAALNFIQTLSAVATKTAAYQAMIAHTEAKILDTRKTLPGLRQALKYAVTCGGGKNHRLGLYDAFLIKENHIQAAGSIKQAIEKARTIAADKPCEIEVEDLTEYQEALEANADIIMLDNFSNHDKRKAVAIRNAGYPHIKLEASGGIDEETLVAVAETGVDYISIGSLTKDIKAIDLSMRIID